MRAMPTCFKSVHFSAFCPIHSGKVSVVSAKASTVRAPQYDRMTAKADIAFS